MKKRYLFLPLIISMMLVSCGEKEGGGGGDTPTPTPTPTPSEKEFTGVTFSNVTVTYDEQAHQLGEVQGAPEGTTITYQGRESYTDAGVYPATATLVKSEYKTKVLNATLTINPLEFTGLTLSDETVTYDGNDHLSDVAVVGTLPSGTSTEYTIKDANGQKVTEAINVGVYNYSVVISCKNYKDKTLTATLTINPRDFSGLTYESVSVTYDGADHFNDVKLVGTQPEGTSTKQTVTNSNGQVVTSAIEVGTYNYVMEVTRANYNKLTLTATLKIKAQKKDMPVFVSSDGMTYFANGLDHRYVYSLNSEGELTRIDYSSPKEFDKHSPDKALFIAGTSFMNSVKEISGGTTKVVYTNSNIDDFAKVSDSIFYYSSNSLTAEKSGIYKVDATNTSDEPVITKVFTGKSDHLAIYGNDLYFTNGNDHNYIYKMALATNETSLVLEEKTHEFVISGTKLYCTVNGLLNDYIGYVDLSKASTSATKLTNASGEFLTIKNNKLYYNYTDLFGSIKPENYGIWSINLSSSDVKQELATDQINGFDVESNGNLVYISTNDLHLYRYNVQTKDTTDLLKDFVAPETIPLNTGGRTIAYGSKVYYLNMHAGKTLYVYDEVSSTNTQLTTNKVQDFCINGDKLFFNQVTMLTNNDVYMVDLKLGSEAEKISSNDIRNMISDGTYIYATHYNWAGTAGGISRMKLDGSEYVKFSEVNGAKNFSIRDGKLYFINCGTAQDNGNIEYITISDITSTSTDLKSTNISKNIKNVKRFIFDGDNIFYLYNGTLDNSVRRTDFTTLGEGTKIASAKTNPNEMIIKDGYVYYYSYPSSSVSYAGFWKVSKDATEDGTQVKIAAYESKYYGGDFALTSDNLYFLNYIPKLVLGDAHFYQLNLTSNVITKVN